MTDYEPIIIDPATGFDAIRHIARMDTTRLSDARILSAAYLPKVEAEIAARFPDWGDMADEHLTLLISAVVMLTAVQAFLAVPNSETSLDYSYNQSVTDTVARLRDEAESILMNLDAVYSSPALRATFLTGPSRRHHHHHC